MYFSSFVDVENIETFHSKNLFGKVRRCGTVLFTDSKAAKDVLNYKNDHVVNDMIIECRIPDRSNLYLDVSRKSPFMRKRERSIDQTKFQPLKKPSILEFCRQNNDFYTKKLILAEKKEFREDTQKITKCSLQLVSNLHNWGSSSDFSNPIRLRPTFTRSLNHLDMDLINKLSLPHFKTPGEIYSAPPVYTLLKLPRASCLYAINSGEVVLSKYGGSNPRSLKSKT